MFDDEASQQLEAYVELLTNVCLSFEENHSSRLCASMARIIKRMVTELEKVGFSREESMSIMTAGMSRLQGRK